MHGVSSFPAVANYRVLAELGAGGMGSVYLARRTGERRPRALKVMRSSLLAHGQNVRRFWREVEVLMLQRHPGIVQLLDAGHTDDGSLYLVTEFIPGRDVFQYIQRSRGVPVAVWLCLANQFLAALSAAHDLVGPDGEPMNLVHRDLKPENVMVDYDGRVVILDFGLAQARASASVTRITRAGQVMGTPKYMSPEQICEPEAVGQRTDQYAAALVLYHLAAGRTTGDDLPNGTDGAPAADMWAKMMDPVWPPLSRLAPSYPPALDDVFAKALALAPVDRFGSVERFRDALRGAAGVEPASAQELGRHLRTMFPTEHRKTSDLLIIPDETEPAFEETAYGSAESHEVTALATAGATTGVGPSTGVAFTRSKTGAVILFAAGLAAFVIAVVLVSIRSPEGPKAPSSVESSAESPRAEPTPRAAQRRPPKAEAPDPSAAPALTPPVRKERTSARKPTRGPTRSRPTRPSEPALAEEAPGNENSRRERAFATVQEALDRGDETAALRVLEALGTHVDRDTWMCLSRGMKTLPLQEVVDRCR